MLVPRISAKDISNVQNDLFNLKCLAINDEFG